MKAYIDYKEWWISNVYPANNGSLYYGTDSEKAFEQHIKDLGLYRLMEKFVEWSRE